MSNPSTGSFRGEAEDSTVVIPISYIRSANLKLIERKYLLKLNSQKDSIINLQKLYISTQKNINDSIQKKLKKSYKREKYYLYGGGILLIGLTILSILK